MHWAPNLGGARPLSMPSGFTGTGSGEAWLVMNGSRMNASIAQATAKSAQNQRRVVLRDVPQYTRPRNTAGAMQCGVRVQRGRVG